LEDGEEVEYIAEYGDKGWYALEVYPTGEHSKEGDEHANETDKKILDEQDGQ